jgi:hypothetical protein
MKNFILLFLSINLISCVSDINQKYNSENTIKFNTFKEILKETWLIDAHKTNNKNYSLFPYDSINEINLSILKKHNVSPEKFINTVTNYSQKPDLIDSLLYSIKVDLEKTYSSLPNEDDSETEELNNNDLKMILNQCPFYSRSLNGGKINMNSDLRDSLFIYFRRNPEKLGHASLRSFSKKLNELTKENKSR